MIRKGLLSPGGGFLAFSSVLWALSAHAIESIYDRGPSTEDILNHRNRKLAPPPHNIKSDRLDPSERFEVALERSESAISLSDSNESSASSSSYEVLLGTNKRIRDKSVSLGVVGGGVSGVVGARAEVALPFVWLGGHVGSGVDYSTWGLGLRKYLFPKMTLLTFFDFRYSQWSLKRAESTEAAFPFPSYATSKFFKNSYEKQTAHLLSPGMGLSYMRRDGFGFEVAAQYLWSLNLEQGAVLGSLGLIKYF